MVSEFVIVIVCNLHRLKWLIYFVLDNCEMASSSSMGKYYGQKFDHQGRVLGLELNELWDGLGDYDGKTMYEYTTVHICFIDFRLKVSILLLFQNSFTQFFQEELQVLCQGIICKWVLDHVMHNKIVC